MRFLASLFTAARQMLDRAEALVSAQERVPVQQLRSLFGGTLAAAHNGLGDFLELGQQSTYVTHRQTYARFVMGLIDRWVEPVEPRDEKEHQVDPSLYAQYEKELAAGQTYNMPEPPEYPGSTMAHTWRIRR